MDFVVYHDVVRTRFTELTKQLSNRKTMLFVFNAALSIMNYEPFKSKLANHTSFLETHRILQTSRSFSKEVGNDIFDLEPLKLNLFGSASYVPELVVSFFRELPFRILYPRYPHNSYAERGARLFRITTAALKHGVCGWGDYDYLNSVLREENAKVRVERRHQLIILDDMLMPDIGWYWRPDAYLESSVPVAKIAADIDARRAYDEMPVLADALEDAGCTEAHILHHCRSPKPHYPGCWLLDRLLGRDQLYSKHDLVGPSQRK